ncbi:ribose 5-phosphate isomerase B [Suicoccus acidiformans]|uniref:Ribose 5-phosphate isomerase B n=1 Tax=Suicoccus acidiformans TaxID=2036206 RepID=A0A347WII7_9LACT|nr:ribose 5-phosphate isomerase B [Suicoccus acidiformans]AXY24894.1 ribose 5-phosphate isomerase B [Suicoccus acidiformans]
MQIAIASDHGGFELKHTIIDHLQNQGYDIVDYGPNSNESVDYPDYSKKVTASITNNESQLGILICGTGVGMSITANKVKGIRASLVSDVYTAKVTREHNNSNVLCLGARVIGDSLALLIVDTWLQAEFEGGRHAVRVDKIE